MTPDLTLLLLATLLAGGGMYSEFTDSGIPQELFEVPIATLGTPESIQVRHARSVDWNTTRKGSRLYLGDLLSTGKRSKVQIVFDDGLIATLGPDTLVELDRPIEGNLYLALVGGSLSVAKGATSVSIRGSGTIVRVQPEAMVVESVVQDAHITVAEANKTHIQESASGVTKIPFNHDDSVNTKKIAAMPTPPPNLDHSDETSQPVGYFNPNLPLALNTEPVSLGPTLDALLPKTFSPVPPAPSLSHATNLSPKPKRAESEPPAAPTRKLAETTPTPTAPVGHSVLPQNTSVPSGAGAGADNQTSLEPSAQSWLPSWEMTPEAESMELSGTDFAGRTLSVASRLGMSLRAKAHWFWNSQWGIAASYQGSYTSFLVPAGASSISAPPVLSDAAIELDFRPNSSVFLTAALAMDQNYFLAPSPGSTVILDSNWIPSLFCQGKMDLFSLGKYDFSLGVGAGLLAPGSAVGYQIFWGYAFTGGLSVAHDISENLRLDLSFNARLNNQDTNIAGQQSRWLGLSLSFIGVSSK
jgi:hypothetical protein